MLRSRTYLNTLFRMCMGIGNLVVQRNVPPRGQLHGQRLLLWLRLVAQHRMETILVRRVVDSADLLQWVHIRIGALHVALSVGHLAVRPIGVSRIPAGRVAEQVWIRRTSLFGRRRMVFVVVLN